MRRPVAALAGFHTTSAFTVETESSVPAGASDAERRTQSRDEAGTEPSRYSSTRVVELHELAELAAVLARSSRATPRALAAEAPPGAARPRARSAFQRAALDRPRRCRRCCAHADALRPARRTRSSAARRAVEVVRGLEKMCVAQSARARRPPFAFCTSASLDDVVVHGVRSALGHARSGRGRGRPPRRPLPLAGKVCALPRVIVEGHCDNGVRLRRTVSRVNCQM